MRKQQIYAAAKKIASELGVVLEHAEELRNAAQEHYGNLSDQSQKSKSGIAFNELVDLLDHGAADIDSAADTFRDIAS